MANDQRRGCVQDAAALVEKSDPAGGHPESGAMAADVQCSGKQVVGTRSASARRNRGVAAELGDIDDVQGNRSIGTVLCDGSDAEVIADIQLALEPGGDGLEIDDGIARDIHVADATGTGADIDRCALIPQHGGVGEIVGSGAVRDTDIQRSSRHRDRAARLIECRVRRGRPKREANGDAADNTRRRTGIVDRHGAARHIDDAIAAIEADIELGSSVCDIEDQGCAVDVQCAGVPESHIQFAWITRLTERDGCSRAKRSGAVGSIGADARVPKVRLIDVAAPGSVSDVPASIDPAVLASIVSVCPGWVATATAASNCA
ncbi:MAG: hypothetical protein WDN50_03480 [Bradyrhizobium sp.]